jgi:hypothetical protein
MMNKKEKENLYQQSAFDAVRSNDIEKLRENLDYLMLLKKSNFIKGAFNKFKYLSSHLLELHSTKNDHKTFIQDLTMMSIHNGNSEITNYLFKSNELLVKPDFEKSSIWAAVFIKGNSEQLNYLLFNSKIKEKNKASLVTSAIKTISESNIEMLNLVFDSSRPGYSEFIENFNKYNRINSPIAFFNPFIYACSQNSISLVDFYLNKEETKPFINYITFHNSLLSAANNDKYLEVLEHLLTDPNMPFKLYKDYNADQLIYMATLGNATEVLRFLIFDMNVQLEKNLDEILANQDAFNTAFGMGEIDANELQKGIENTKKFLVTRDLKEQLQDDLGNILTPKSKKPKM